MRANTRRTTQNIRSGMTCWTNSIPNPRRVTLSNIGRIWAKGKALAMIPNTGGISEMGIKEPLNKVRKINIPIKSWFACASVVQNVDIKMPSDKANKINKVHSAISKVMLPAMGKPKTK